MAKTKPAANITLSDTIVQNIIELKLKKKRITMKKIAEKLRVERQQVTLVIDRENQRWKKNQALTAMAFVPETENTDHGNNGFEENYSDDGKNSESNEQNEKFEMKNGLNVFGNGSNLVVKNSANGGSELFESQKPRQPNEYSPVSNEEDSGYNQTYKKGISEDEFDLEDHQEDEKFETNNSENVFGNRSDLVDKNSTDGGREDFDFEAIQELPHPTQYFADFDQLSNFFESTKEFMVYVRNLENSFLRLGNSVQAKNELIKNKHSDLMGAVRMMKQLEIKLTTAEAREKKLEEDLSASNIRSTIATEDNHQIQIKLTNALEENQRLKKEYAVLQASQNENKNQCGACQKKLVFTVGNMIVCRSCSDEIKLQFSFHGCQ